LNTHNHLPQWGGVEHITSPASATTQTELAQNHQAFAQDHHAKRHNCSLIKQFENVG